MLTVVGLWSYFFFQGWGLPDYSVGGTGVMPVALITLASAAAMVGGSLLSKPPDQQTVDRFFA